VGLLKNFISAKARNNWIWNLSLVIKMNLPHPLPLSLPHPPFGHLLLEEKEIKRLGGSMILAP